MKFAYQEGATPYNLDDAFFLIPKHITTQKELNEWEQNNIRIAEIWLFTRKRKGIISADFIKLLHKKMFDRTWTWAGQFRHHLTNIGVVPYLIPIELRKLCDDVFFWIANKSFPTDEIAARFHHKLVFIHLFPNGNGRHARIITDALLISLNRPRFTWGKINLTNSSKTRHTYIESLQHADNGDYTDLMAFVRS